MVPLILLGIIRLQLVPPILLGIIRLQLVRPILLGPHECFFAKVKLNYWISWPTMMFILVSRRILCCLVVPRPKMCMLCRLVVSRPRMCMLCCLVVPRPRMCMLCRLVVLLWHRSILRNDNRTVKEESWYWVKINIKNSISRYDKRHQMGQSTNKNHQRVKFVPLCFGYPLVTPLVAEPNEAWGQMPGTGAYIDHKHLSLTLYIMYHSCE